MLKLKYLSNFLKLLNIIELHLACRNDCSQFVIAATSFPSAENSVILIGAAGHFRYMQGCSGAGTRGNGVPTPFSRFALK